MARDGVLRTPPCLLSTISLLSTPVRRGPKLSVRGQVLFPQKMDGPIWSSLLCDDVYMRVPWDNPWALHYGAPSSLVYDRSACKMWHRSQPERVYVQRCAPEQQASCPQERGKCVPLRTSAPLGQLDVAHSCRHNPRTGGSVFQAEHATCGLPPGTASPPAADGRTYCFGGSEPALDNSPPAVGTSL